MSHASFPANGFGSRQPAVLVSSFGRADAGTTKDDGTIRFTCSSGRTGADSNEHQFLRRRTDRRRRGSAEIADKARRTVYEMAARECDLLREVLAKDCRMESVNNNIGRQTSQQQ